MKVLLLVLLGAVLVSSSSNSLTSLFGCQITGPARFNFGDLLDWKLAIRLCDLEQNSLETCTSRLDDCRATLSNIDSALTQVGWSEIRSDIEECDACMDLRLNLDLIPETFDGICPSLDYLFKVGFTFQNNFPLYKCIARKIDAAGLKNFQMCINGQ